MIANIKNWRSKRLQVKIKREQICKWRVRSDRGREGGSGNRQLLEGQGRIYKCNDWSLQMGWEWDPAGIKKKASLPLVVLLFSFVANGRLSLSSPPTSSPLKSSYIYIFFLLNKLKCYIFYLLSLVLTLTLLFLVLLFTFNTHFS